MKTKLTTAVFSLLLLASTPVFAHSKSEFHDAMRKLWADHMQYTRMYIISAAAGLPDANVTAQRLLNNQSDIGNAVAEFYGKDAGDKLTALLKDHILIAADLVGAAKAGDNAKVTELNKKWTDNADEIAVFLHGANPKHWPEATLKDALHMHLSQTLQEATHRLQGKFEEDIKDYDAAFSHMMMVSDILAKGIIEQFPKKFDKA
ncbi:MAG TPA: glycosyltransferase [Thermoanaerobaculia bacterium]